MGKKLDLTNKIFGRLTAIKHSEERQHKRLAWDCLCSCGETITVSTLSLRSGKTTSCGCLRGLPKGEGGFRLVLRDYKKSAKKRNLTFSLTDEEFLNIVTQNCYYCGEKPSKISEKNRRGEFCCNGIDRLDSSKGYVLNNLVPCCKQCNYSKLKISEEAFYLWAQKLSDNLKLKGKIN